MHLHTTTTPSLRLTTEVTDAGGFSVLTHKNPITKWSQAVHDISASSLKGFVHRSNGCHSVCVATPFTSVTWTLILHLNRSDQFRLMLGQKPRTTGPAYSP